MHRSLFYDSTVNDLSNALYPGAGPCFLPLRWVRTLTKPERRNEGCGEESDNPSLRESHEPGTYQEEEEDRTLFVTPEGA